MSFARSRSALVVDGESALANRAHRRRAITRACTVLACTIVSSSVHAQAVLYDFFGGASGDLCGTALTTVGDFDGDTVPDFAIGILRSETPLVDAGRVRIHSGASGVILRDWTGPGVDAQFGSDIAAAGDLNSDGTPDVFVGLFTWGPSVAMRPGAVRAISGSNGQTLFEVLGDQHNEWYGASIAALGDVNGDGKCDLAVGGPRFRDLVGQQGAIGRVEVLSGLDGSVLYTLYGRGDNSGYGASVRAAGNVNADAIPDLIVGAYGDSVNLDRAGYVHVVSGIDGATIHAIEGEQAVMLFGQAVAGAGDVDGDGRADFLVGAPNFDAPGVEDAGVTRLFSGASGALLRSWTGDSALERCGAGIAGGGDIDLDGVPDVILGSRRHQAPGRVRVRSGATGDPIYTLDGASAADELGIVVAWLGDLDGDNRPEFGASAPNDDVIGNDAGRVRVWRACTAPRSYCVGKVNSLGCVPTMSITGSASLTGADDLVVTAQQVINQSRGMMIWSRQPNSTPFAGGTLCLLPPLRRTPIVVAGGSPPGVRDCTGAISLAFTHAYARANGMRPGDLVHCQAWARDVQSADGTGLSLSNALEFRWCP